MTTFDQWIESHPVDESRVKKHVARLKAEVRAYRPAELRQISNLTQEQVAARLEISRKRVSEIERGELARTKVATLQRYAQAVGGTLRVQLLVDGDNFELL